MLFVNVQRVALLNLYEMARRYEHVKHLEKETKPTAPREPLRGPQTLASAVALRVPDVTAATFTANKTE